VEFVVDGGASPANRPSTVVDVTVEPVRILRLGAIEPERVREVLERTAAP
jgi:tRNA A37 threonylcarbamoyladenosine synthetase subunit TsaC/SUA5/YrdC